MAMICSPCTIARWIKYPVIVKLILRTAHQFKIIQMIEFLLAILMIYVGFWWDRADKGLDNEAMNQADMRCSILSEEEIAISVSSNSRTHDVRSRTNETSNPTLITNFIASFKSEYWFPQFCISH